MALPRIEPDTSNTAIHTVSIGVVVVGVMVSAVSESDSHTVTVKFFSTAPFIFTDGCEGAGVCVVSHRSIAARRA
jgi:hypothetical protein